MIRLVQYIKEALNPKVNKWIKSVNDSMQKLIKDKNKIEPIKVNADDVGGPEKPFSFKDLSDSSAIREIVSNKQYGFPITDLIIKNSKSFLTDKDSEKELNPDAMLYFSRSEEPKETEKNNAKGEAPVPTYFVGIIIFDKSQSYIDNFCHVVNAEYSLCVANGDEMMKNIFKNFTLHQLNKIGKFSGLTAKPTNPKQKAALVKLGFNSFKYNKDLLTYEI